MGRRSTPNWTDESEEAVKRLRNTASDYRGGSGTPAHLTNCPWCGQPLNPGRDIQVETYAQGRALEAIGERAGVVNADNAVEGQVRQELNVLLDQWLNRAQSTVAPAILGYRERKDGRTVSLLKPVECTGRNPFMCLNSLRDVEPGVPLVLNNYGMDREPDEPVEERS